MYFLPISFLLLRQTLANADITETLRKHVFAEPGNLLPIDPNCRVRWQRELICA